MTTSKERLEQRHESAMLLETRLRIVLADIDTAISYAEKAGCTAFTHELKGFRGRAATMQRKSRGVTHLTKRRLAAAEAAQELSHG